MPISRKLLKDNRKTIDSTAGGKTSKVCRGCGSSLPPDYEGRLICARCVDNPPRILERGRPSGAPVEYSPMEREMAMRQLSRKYLIPFILRHDPSYQPGWVHKDIARRLEKFVKDVEDKKSPRLMLFMPPRHGKSREVSQEFTAWALGLHPEWELIAASYAVSLPIEFSRFVRERVKDPSYKATFPRTLLSDSSQGAESWRTIPGGGFLAAGVGGPLTGRGAHILIIDDPVKNAEEAESETIRNNIWNWYTSTAYTRLAPGGGVLIVQTRWHLDDLGGRLEAAMKEDPEADQWEVVRYPAIATEDEAHRAQGEALHPERYDVKALRRIEKAVGPRVWNALYQQNPVPDEGAYFTQQMLKFYDDKAPEPMEIYNTWDLAVGQKQRNDFSVGLKWGIDTSDNIWILDRIRGRYDAMELIDCVLDLYASSPNTRECGMEEGQIKLAIGPFLEKRMQERRMYSFNLQPLKPGRQDKEARARTIQGRMRQGKVYLPRNAPWVSEFIAELLQFPFGTHDDQVDVLAYAGIQAAQYDPPALDMTAAIDTTNRWMHTLRRFVAGGKESKHWQRA